jgi:hypothetical protein
LPPLRRHHSYDIIITIAVGWHVCANCVAGSGPGNARPPGAASSLYLVASSLPCMALSSSSTSAGTYIPTSLLPWLGLLVPALPNMKTMLVAFVLPPSSWTCYCFHIHCCQRPSLCRTARCNQGNGRAFIFASGRPLSAMAVMRGILVAHCARPQGTDAVACWQH